jgi:hypothetical protein
MQLGELVMGAMSMLATSAMHEKAVIFVSVCVMTKLYVAH